jgi:hypothetical protein
MAYNITVLLDAGLRIEAFHEHQTMYWKVSDAVGCKHEHI